MQTYLQDKLTGWTYSSGHKIKYENAEWIIKEFYVSPTTREHRVVLHDQDGIMLDLPCVELDLKIIDAV